MKVAVEGPPEFSGAMLTTLMQRRGMIIGTEEHEGLNRIEGEVPLAEMFGYATILRSNTQGKAEFTMEFKRYEQAPKSITEELIKAYEKSREAKK